jgi:pyridoxamine 5'-phosphate oxidase
MWLDEALHSKVIDPNAMTVATVDDSRRPTSRVVLLKGFAADGFVFFTNYDSKKAADLDSNPNISLHFFWPDLERQIIISGIAEKTSREESEKYFASRPRDSQLGAWASKQSSVLKDRKELENRFAVVNEQFEGNDIPCPTFWGGYRVTPNRFEFWQGRASRLHDRICYERHDNNWKISRLSP